MMKSRMDGAGWPNTRPSHVPAIVSEAVCTRTNFSQVLVDDMEKEREKEFKSFVHEEKTLYI